MSTAIYDVTVSEKPTPNERNKGITARSVVLREYFIDTERLDEIRSQFHEPRFVIDVVHIGSAN